MSRRNFAGLTLASAGVSLVPFGASAASRIDTLCVTCIHHTPDDDDAVGRAYSVALAGGSLGGVSPRRLHATVMGFWQQMKVARDLHGIRRVVVCDHLGCGAFETEFNGGEAMDAAVELEKHRQVQARFARRFYAFDWGFSGPPPDGVSFTTVSAEGRLL